MSKPFNLQEALAGKPVTMRNGISVIGIVHMPFAEASSRVIGVAPLGALIVRNVHGTIEARCLVSPQPSDLVMAAEPKSGWICLWRQSPSYIFGVYDYSTTGPFATQEVAEGQRSMSLSNVHKELLGVYPVTWEE